MYGNQLSVKLSSIVLRTAIYCRSDRLIYILVIQADLHFMSYRLELYILDHTGWTCIIIAVQANVILGHIG